MLQRGFGQSEFGQPTRFGQSGYTIPGHWHEEEKPWYEQLADRHYESHDVIYREDYERALKKVSLLRPTIKNPDKCVALAAIIMMLQKCRKIHDIKELYQDANFSAKDSVKIRHICTSNRMSTAEYHEMLSVINSKGFLFKCDSIVIHILNNKSFDDMLDQAAQNLSLDELIDDVHLHTKEMDRLGTKYQKIAEQYRAYRDIENAHV